jgi:hypothetical protein
MSHEWAEELAELAREHHKVFLPMPGMVILTREQMAAGKRASATPPRAGDIRPAGEDRWMKFNGQSWEPSDTPCSVFDNLSMIQNVAGDYQLLSYPEHRSGHHAVVREEDHQPDDDLDRERSHRSSIARRF